MTNYLDDVIDVHVILSVEKSHRHMAEVTLKTRAGAFVASAESQDMYQSLSQVMDKLEAQTHKHHEKLSSKPHESIKSQAVVGE
jgi:putative sigma-54 modulation protein